MSTCNRNENYFELDGIMTMKLETIIYEIQGNVATITLNRPDAKNAINLQMAKDLLSVALTCNADPNVRALIICGSGNTFCVGGDVKEFHANIDVLSNHLKEITTYLHAAISILSRINVPLVVGINGFVAGAGIGLACLGDIIVATESSRFTVAYTGIGLTPDAGTTYLLPRAIGLKKASELILTNRQLSASDALAIGLVTNVVPDGEIIPHINSVATQLATCATRALAMSKNLLQRGWTETLETHMQNESDVISQLGHTDDAKEGILAFAEKRRPRFLGR